MCSNDYLPFMKFLNLFCCNFIDQRRCIEDVERDVKHFSSLVSHLQSVVECTGEDTIVSHTAVVVAAMGESHYDFFVRRSFVR